MRLLAVLGLNKVPGREVPLGLAALSLGAAAIHFAVISDHFAEYWLFGLFFALVGWYQAGWAVLYALRPSGFLGFTALVVNAGTIGLWVWTRTIGLPIGPHAGELEAPGNLQRLPRQQYLVERHGLCRLLERLVN